VYCVSAIQNESADRTLSFEAVFDPTMILAVAVTAFPNTEVLVHPRDVVDRYASWGFGDAVMLYVVFVPNSPSSDIHPVGRVAAYANVEFDDALVTIL
jgi:hypothetical protein